MAYVNVLEWKAEQVSEWLQGKNTKMSTIVEQGQPALVQPRQRSDAQNESKHEESARAERMHAPVGVIDLGTEGQQRRHQPNKPSES